MAIVNIERFRKLSYYADQSTNTFTMTFVTKDGQSFEETVDLIVDNELNPECLEFVNEVDVLKKKEAQKEEARKKAQEAEKKVVDFEKIVDSFTPEEVEALKEYFSGNNSYENSKAIEALKEKYNLSEEDLKVAQMYRVSRNYTAEKEEENLNNEYSKYDDANKEYAQNYAGSDGSAPTQDNETVEDEKEEEKEVQTDSSSVEPMTNQTSQVNAGPQQTVNKNQISNVRRTIFELEQDLKSVVKRGLKGEELEKTLNALSRGHDVSIDSVKKVYEKTVLNESVRKSLAARRLIRRRGSGIAKARVVQLEDIPKENVEGFITDFSNGLIMPEYIDEWNEMVTFMAEDKAVSMVTALNVISKANDGDSYRELRKYLNEMKAKYPDINLQEVIGYVQGYSKVGEIVAKKTKSVLFNNPKKVVKAKVQRESLIGKIKTNVAEKCNVQISKSRILTNIKKEVDYKKSKKNNKGKLKLRNKLKASVVDRVALFADDFDDLSVPFRKMKYGRATDDELARLRDLREEIEALKDQESLEPAEQELGRTR